MNMNSALRLFLFTLLLTAISGWLYLTLGAGLTAMHPFKIGVQALCAICLFGIVLRERLVQVLDVALTSPVAQTGGLLAGIALALVASGPAMSNITGELSRLGGFDLIVAILRPLLICYVAVFLPMSLIARAINKWRETRSVKRSSA